MTIKGSPCLLITGTASLLFSAFLCFFLDFLGLGPVGSCRADSLVSFSSETESSVLAVDGMTHYWAGF